ncbi:hypothetical protein KKC16_03065, partial [Patescibacteria group bacterium]|nr:hypothetical protein [Patescibacteria group bacterium]
KYRIIKTLTSLNTLIHTDPPAKAMALRAGVNTDSHRCAGKSFVVCRELTKKFETIYRGNINEVLEQVKNDVVKGEYVVISGMSS